MNINELSTELIWRFIIIFSRIGSLFAALPGISESFVSARIRLTTALIISFVITPILSEYVPNFPESIITITSIVIQEVIIGIFFGCITRLILAAANIAGNILAMQSSFSSATMFDPTQGSQGAIIGNFYSLAAITLMFVTDIHHLVIQGIVSSFSFFQINTFFHLIDFSEFTINTVTESFLIGIKISAPYLMIGLLLNVTSGLIARVMPNMQVFFILTPLQILICLITLNITFISSLNWYLEQLAYIIKNFLNLN